MGKDHEQAIHRRGNKCIINEKILISLDINEMFHTCHIDKNLVWLHQALMRWGNRNGYTLLVIVYIAIPHYRANDMISQKIQKFLFILI